MATSASVSLGTTLGFKPEATPGGGTYDAAFSTIAELVSFDGPGLGRVIIESTGLLTGTAVTQFQQRLAGVANLGVLNCTVNFVSAAAAGTSGSRTHYDLIRMFGVDSGYTHSHLNAKPPEWLITFPGAAADTWQFFGFLSGFSLSGSVDQPLQAQISIEIVEGTNTDGISIAT